MANLSYIEGIKKMPPALSLYHYVKQDPKNNIKRIYKNNTSSVLLNRVYRFQEWFRSWPGDGVLFFHDVLLSELSGVYCKDTLRPDEYNKLFNYLYSFKSDFTAVSRGALAAFLLDCPYLAVPLYKYRKQFDTKAFNTLVQKTLYHRSFPDFTVGEAGKHIARFIWNAILSYKAPLDVCDNTMFMHLYYSYTDTAMRRFFLLSTAKSAVKQHIQAAFNAYKQTSLLLNCWTEKISILYRRNRVIPQMSSIKAMIKYHDLKTEEMIAEQRNADKMKYSWEELTKVIQDVSPEWYLPEYPSDIRLRGQQHHNCIGGYVDRHFAPVIDNMKMLLLFTDECEAEVHVYFGELVKDTKVYIGCRDVKIMQARTAYNREIKTNDFLELKEVVKAFRKLPVEAFSPEKEESEE